MSDTSKCSCTRATDTKPGVVCERCLVCGNCGGKIQSGREEGCWYCHVAYLCGDCWSRVGHCGHVMAHEINRLSREARSWEERDAMYRLRGGLDS